MKRLFNYGTLSALIVGLIAVASYAAPPPPPAPVPEPSTWILVGTGVAGVALYKYVKNRKK